MKKIIGVIFAVATTVILGACGSSGASYPPLTAATMTSTTAVPTTTTSVELTTTTTTLPAVPTFVVLCPSEATFGYFGKPTSFTVGYQGWVGTTTMTLDISWGDGQASRFTSLTAFDKQHRTHGYGPGSYQVSILLTDAYGRTASSNCNIKWTDSLPATMNAFDCIMRRNQITTWEPSGQYGFLQPKSVPDPACAGK